ncbi:spermidine resistance protein [Dispira simplex]|nr:spermidine resistance protein [Dispira simplex]
MLTPSESKHVPLGLESGLQGDSSPSSTSYPNGFEGPEKLLEVWFKPSLRYVSPPVTTDPQSQPTLVGLRRVPRQVWEGMLKLVHCAVLSVINNHHVDAYLLSESSFFVYPHKVILKTCGTTTLLHAVPELLRIAREYCQWNSVWRTFYSRKRFMFPDQQQFPHQAWTDEVACLDGYFNNGSAYTVGPSNGDHWNLYLTSPNPECSIPTPASTTPHSPAEPSLMTYPESGSDLHYDQDITVEILMTELAPESARQFYQSSLDHPTGSSQRDGQRVAQLSGISKIYPFAQTDAYLFEPCGFSLNGLAQEDHYFTIHVTPEPQCSYASFETNLTLDSHHRRSSAKALKALVKQVVGIFQPGKFSVSVFKTHSKQAPSLGRQLQQAQTNTLRVNTLGHDAALTPMDTPTHTGSSSVDPSDDSEDEMVQWQSWRQFAESLPPWNLDSLENYRQLDHIMYEFDYYWLRFGYFERVVTRS